MPHNELPQIHSVTDITQAIDKLGLDTKRLVLVNKNSLRGRSITLTTFSISSLHNNPVMRKKTLDAIQEGCLGGARKNSVGYNQLSLNRDVVAKLLNAKVHPTLAAEPSAKPIIQNAGADSPHDIDVNIDELNLEGIDYDTYAKLQETIELALAALATDTTGKEVTKANKKKEQAHHNVHTAIQHVESTPRPLGVKRKAAEPSKRQHSAYQDTLKGQIKTGQREASKKARVKKEEFEEQKKERVIKKHEIQSDNIRHERTE